MVLYDRFRWLAALVLFRPPARSLPPSLLARGRALVVVFSPTSTRDRALVVSLFGHALRGASGVVEPGLARVVVDHFLDLGPSLPLCLVRVVHCLLQHPCPTHNHHSRIRRGDSPVCGGISCTSLSTCWAQFLRSRTGMSRHCGLQCLRKGTSSMQPEFG